MREEEDRNGKERRGQERGGENGRGEDLICRQEVSSVLNCTRGL